MADSSDIRLTGLADAWGKRHHVLPDGTPNFSALDMAVPALETLFRKMPESRLRVRIPGTHPDSGALQRIAMADIADLQDYLASGKPLHLQATDLHEYHEGFNAVLRAFASQVKQEIPEVRAPGTFMTIGLFLSTPGAVAPFHADHEHNFLAQVVGSKHMHLFSPTDLELFTSEARERLACDDIHVLNTYSEAAETRAEIVYLEPGTAIYHPPMGPHWVDTGKSSYSLSISVSFVPQSVDKVLLLHKVNRRLRGFGLSPAPVGEARVFDELKYQLAKIARNTARLVRQTV